MPPLDQGTQVQASRVPLMFTGCECMCLCTGLSTFEWGNSATTPDGLLVRSIITASLWAVGAASAGVASEQMSRRTQSTAGPARIGSTPPFTRRDAESIQRHALAAVRVIESSALVAWAWAELGLGPRCCRAWVTTTERTSRKTNNNSPSLSSSPFALPSIFFHHTRRQAVDNTHWVIAKKKKNKRRPDYPLPAPPSPRHPIRHLRAVCLIQKQKHKPGFAIPPNWLLGAFVETYEHRRRARPPKSQRRVSHHPAAAPSPSPVSDLSPAEQSSQRRLFFLGAVPRAFLLGFLFCLQALPLRRAQTYLFLVSPIPGLTDKEKIKTHRLLAWISLLGRAFATPALAVRKLHQLRVTRRLFAPESTQAHAAKPPSHLLTSFSARLDPTCTTRVVRQRSPSQGNQDKAPLAWPEAFFASDFSVIAVAAHHSPVPGG
ncbi:hypothetical protein B0J13DRAFT_635467 [Dactylonectria estremocensis]|uniref:Uncharacterized protein n=1 Tax=Dactylonectria estremocensis TaxID=1079267 RepID=A0A9P9ETN6_9HYPO|nr:hypothetical protein B0J13DRAFT_635467 [Dactylonectria estremocensis]